MLFNILLSRLVPYAPEIIVDHQCGFCHNRSTTNNIFCIKYFRVGEYTEAVHQLFIVFKKANGSVRREVLFGILKQLQHSLGRKTFVLYVFY
jgi:hypothetical protein